MYIRDVIGMNNIQFYRCFPSLILSYRRSHSHAVFDLPKCCVFVGDHRQTKGVNGYLYDCPFTPNSSRHRLIVLICHYFIEYF